MERKDWKENGERCEVKDKERLKKEQIKEEHNTEIMEK
jgi:hypothetical protein